MILLIPAAGESKRFSRAGYTTPKPLLPVDADGTSMIQAVVNRWKSSVSRVVIMQRPQDSIRVEAKCKRFYGLVGSRARTTSGPMATAYYFYEYVYDDEETMDQELLINYCDVLFPTSHARAFLLAARNRGVDAQAAIFTSKSKRFQYWSRDKENNLVVVNKDDDKPGLAFSGVFYFKRVLDFFKAAYPILDINGPEQGIPDALARMTTTGQMVGSYIRSDIIDLGTPEDYEEWISHQSSF